MAILDLEWGRNLAPRDGQKIPCIWTGNKMITISHKLFFTDGVIMVSRRCIRKSLIHRTAQARNQRKENTRKGKPRAYVVGTQKHGLNSNICLD